MEQRANSILTRLAATSSRASRKPLLSSSCMPGSITPSPGGALFVDNEGPRLLIFVLPGIRHHSCLARLALHQRSRDAAFQSPRRAKWQKANRITRRRAPLRWPKSLPSLCATSGLCHRNNLSFGGTSHVAILKCCAGLW